MTGSVVLGEMLSLADELPLGEIEPFHHQLASAERLYFYAVGRCGLVVRMFAMRLMHLGYTCHVVGDVTTPAISPRDLLVVASGSGTTPTTVTIADNALSRGVPVILLTNHPAAPLASRVSRVIVIPGVHKHAQGFSSQQPTGSLFEQMLLCFLEEVVCHYMRARRLESAALMERHANLE